ncbi:MAG: hypothetical protein QM736_28360 [Vicinamibacterales bacterium]
MVSGTSFSTRFERAYGAVPLPAVYREFITSGAYVLYRRAYVRNLLGYNGSDVEVRLDSSLLLAKARLLESAGIDDGAEAFHPIAVIPGSSEFLAIDMTQANAPVFLCRHDTGAFHPQFESFQAFVGALRLPQDISRERRERRRWFASMREECGLAARKAEAALDRGDLDVAAAILDRALANRRPVTYDGRNDFTAIGMLCACYVLRGRVALARGDVRAAHDAFLDATACGGKAYWDAAVALAITSFLLADTEVADARLRIVDTSDFPVAPITIARECFTSAQIDDVIRMLEGWPHDDPRRAFAVRVHGWLSAPEKPRASDDQA